MFALNFCIVYLFEFLVLIEGVKDVEEGRWLCVTISTMHEMLKSSS
jgi:hypothetical protein